MEKNSSNKESVPGGKDRIRIYNLIDLSCELAVKKGAHSLDADCQCLACMTKRKKLLYPIDTDWKYTI